MCSEECFPFSASIMFPPKKEEDFSKVKTLLLLEQQHLQNPAVSQHFAPRLLHAVPSPHIAFLHSRSTGRACRTWHPIGPLPLPVIAAVTALLLGQSSLALVSVPLCILQWATYTPGDYLLAHCSWHAVTIMLQALTDQVLQLSTGCSCPHGLSCHHTWGSFVCMLSEYFVCLTTKNTAVGRVSGHHFAALNPTRWVLLHLWYAHRRRGWPPLSDSTQGCPFPSCKPVYRYLSLEGFKKRTDVTLKDTM